MMRHSARSSTSVCTTFTSSFNEARSEGFEPLSKLLDEALHVPSLGVIFKSRKASPLEGQPEVVQEGQLVPFTIEDRVCARKGDENAVRIAAAHSCLEVVVRCEVDYELPVDFVQFPFLELAGDVARRID